MNNIIANHHWALTESKLLSMAAMDFTVTMDDDEDSDVYGDDDEAYQVVNGVAVIPIVGTLFKYDDIFSDFFGGISTLALQNKLQAALDDPTVTATLLIIDSGGGQIDGTTDLAEVIAGSSKPVWAYVSDTCCSGAYWIASQCDQIFANTAASIGSIGVYTVLPDTSKMYEAAGISINLIKAGDHKGTGVDGTPVTDDQISDIQREIDDYYALFIEAVATGRGSRLKDASKVATGQSWIAAKATKMGLIDGVGTLNEIAGQLQKESKKMANSFKVEAVPAVVAEVSNETMATELAALKTEVASFPAKLEEARKEAVAAENARLSSLVEVAGERPAFVLEQLKLGHSKAEALEALTVTLKAELAESKKAVATQVVSGAPAVANSPVDTRMNASDGWESLTPAEQKQIGSKELYESYKKALTKFNIK
jgi:signal peptide peptidase SppA